MQAYVQVRFIFIAYYAVSRVLFIRTVARVKEQHRRCALVDAPGVSPHPPTKGTLTYATVTYRAVTYASVS